jgi:hypothetical protein
MTLPRQLQRLSHHLENQGVGLLTNRKMGQGQCDFQRLSHTQSNWHALQMKYCEWSVTTQQDVMRKPSLLAQKHYRAVRPSSPQALPLPLYSEAKDS